MEHIEVDGIRTVQFDEYDVDHHDWDTGGWPYGFTAAMVSTCTPLFDECDDNYEVRDKLKRAGVITRGISEDSESCQFFVYFRNKRMGLAFIRRLNAYLAKKAKRIATAQATMRAARSF
jgi:hypothetical protein